MAVYESEQEQIEAIKKWWKENGTAVVTGFLIGLGLLVGWRWWQTYTDQQAQIASMSYDQVLYALEQGEVNKAQQMAQLLLSKHSRSPYAALAVLNLAHQDLAAGDIEAAHARLQWIIEQNSSIPEITHLARLRKARLFLSQEKVAKAKQLLEGIDTQTVFTAAYAELQGDIAKAENQLEVARDAYAKALESEELAPKHRDFLQMKLDDLGFVTENQIESQPPLAALATPNTEQNETVLTIPSEPIPDPSTTQVNEITIPIAPVPASQENATEETLVTSPAVE